MVSTLNSQADTETAGTITPPPPPSLTKKSTNYSDMSLVLDENQYIEEQKKFFKDLEQKYESTSLTESEYFTAHSGFTTDSTASSSIWK